MSCLNDIFSLKSGENQKKYFDKVERVTSDNFSVLNNFYNDNFIPLFKDYYLLHITQAIQTWYKTVTGCSIQIYKMPYTTYTHKSQFAKIVLFNKKNGLNSKHSDMINNNILMHFRQINIGIIKYTKSSDEKQIRTFIAHELAHVIVYALMFIFYNTRTPSQRKDFLRSLDSKTSEEKAYKIINNTSLKKMVMAVKKEYDSNQELKLKNNGQKYQPSSVMMESFVNMITAVILTEKANFILTEHHKHTFKDFDDLIEYMSKI